MSKLGEEKHIHTVLSTMGIEQFDPMVPTALDEYAARKTGDLAPLGFPLSHMTFLVLSCRVCCRTLKRRARLFYSRW
jgi:hypothetical protein